MGTSRWDPDTWSKHSTTTRTKSTREIFSNSNMDKDMDPKNITVRESRDSAANPNSTPLILGLDVTGSMGVVADNLARSALGVLVEEILSRKPIEDPHILVMGIGDATVDEAPLQMGQFEADLTITKWLEKIYLEHGGGGNDFESYDLAFYAATYLTSCDNFEKRGKKGYIFTFGDEPPPKKVRKEHVQKVFGKSAAWQTDINFEDLISLTRKSWHPFHVIIEQGSYLNYGGASAVDTLKKRWQKVLGQNVLTLKDYTKVGELVVSTLQVMNGEELDTVAKSWGGGTELVVREALKDLTGTNPSSGKGGVVRF